jgi:hypothetical protein
VWANELGGERHQDNAALHIRLDRALGVYSFSTLFGQFHCYQWTIAKFTPPPKLVTRSCELMELSNARNDDLHWYSLSLSMKRKSSLSYLHVSGTPPNPPEEHLKFIPEVKADSGSCNSFVGS